MIESKLRLLKFGYLKKTIRHLRVYGFSSTVLRIRRKLVQPDHFPSTIDPLTRPVKYIIDDEPGPETIDAFVSVVIPTRNAGDNFPFLLNKLRNQKGIRECEIIIVDSGSTDETLETARKENVKIIEIPREEFNHAYSRNKGAECAAGDYILFITQDALPLTDRWLWELTASLIHNSLAAVSCAEYPRSDCDLFYQWIIWNHYRTLNLQKDRILQWGKGCDSYLSLRANSQINNIAALIKKSIFSQYGFRVPYAEDLDLGIRLIRDGHRTGFLYSTRVLHSHNRSAYYFLKRSYVDTKSLCEIFKDFPRHKISNSRKFFRDALGLFFKTKALLPHLEDVLEEETVRIDAVMDKISAMYKESRHAALPYDTSPCDDDLDAFMHSLISLSEERDFPYKHTENSITPDFFSSIESLHAFISRGRDIADRFFIKELESALMKILALTIGSHIAFLYLTWNGKGEGEPFPGDLDDILSKEI